MVVTLFSILTWIYPFVTQLWALLLSHYSSLIVGTLSLTYLIYFLYIHSRSVTLSSLTKLSALPELEKERSPGRHEEGEDDCAPVDEQVTAIKLRDIRCPDYARAASGAQIMRKEHPDVKRVIASG